MCPISAKGIQRTKTILTMSSNFVLSVERRWAIDTNNVERSESELTFVYGYVRVTSKVCNLEDVVNYLRFATVTRGNRPTVMKFLKTWRHT